MSDSAIPWTASCQASLSITISLSWLKLMSVELVMPSNHLILCCPPFSSCPWFFPASGSFPMSQLFASGGQIIGASASASVLPMNIQGWFPLGLTGLISLLSKGLSRVIFSVVPLQVLTQLWVALASICVFVDDKAWPCLCPEFSCFFPSLLRVSSYLLLTQTLWWAMLDGYCISIL